jgi:hypothetical protein
MAINAYNHYMGGVDLANQLRASFTTLRAQNLHYWKPLFYWLLDIALVNNYLLYRAISGELGDPRDYKAHRRFLEALVQALITYSMPLEPPRHQQVYRDSRAYCAYCRKNKDNWKPRHSQPRTFGIDITNRGPIGGINKANKPRGSKTQWGCQQCNVPLCKIGDCWRLWHENRQ